MGRRVRSRHRITLPLPAGQAFMLFTPAGEAHWVPGWAPRYLHPADGRTEAGMVFTTGEGEDFTVWHLADFDRGALSSRYVRSTPASRSGFVRIDCRPLGAERTEVAVEYEMTALSDGTAGTLDAYEGEAFAAMIEQWRELIEARLPALRALAVP